VIGGPRRPRDPERLGELSAVGKAGAGLLLSRSSPRMVYFVVWSDARSLARQDGARLVC